MTRTTTTLGLTAALLAALAAPVLAHEEAKTKIDSSVILDITAPRPGTGSSNRAFDESIKRDPPAANPKTEWKQQPDGSYKYGNTTIIIRHDCPPGGEFFEPPSLPGRRR